MIEIVAPGPLLTVQDLGRPAARRYGVATGGAMDASALVAANRLVGNAPGAAALELTAGGVELRFTRPALVSLAGGDLGATLDGRPLPLWRSLLVDAGATLRLAGRSDSWGARAYLALAGGIDLPPVLGSRATDLAGGFGGLGGRPLRAGDRLPIGAAPADTSAALGRLWPPEHRPPYAPAPTLRFVPGPHLDCLAPDALAQLADAALRVSPISNRMGYRLEGLALPYARPCSLPSLGVVPGCIQIPPDGAPILLLADAQTTGGYPLAGAVIAADLPLAAQLLPGDALRIAPVDLDAAIAARRVYDAAISAPLDADDGDLLAWMAGASG